MRKKCFLLIFNAFLWSGICCLYCPPFSWFRADVDALASGQIMFCGAALLLVCPVLVDDIVTFLINQLLEWDLYILHVYVCERQTCLSGCLSLIIYLFHLLVLLGHFLFELCSSTDCSCLNLHRYLLSNQSSKCTPGTYLIILCTKAWKNTAKHTAVLVCQVVPPVQDFGLKPGFCETLSMIR